MSLSCERYRQYTTGSGPAFKHRLKLPWGIRSEVDWKTYVFRRAVNVKITKIFLTNIPEIK